MAHARGARTLRLQDDIATFVEGGRIVLIATRDATLRPHITRALAPRLDAHSSRMSLCVPIRESAQCLADLQQCPSLAITVVDPRTYRTYQLKGRVTDRRDPGPAERHMLERYTPAVIDACESVGIGAEVTSRLWSQSFTCLQIALEHGYTQTPGDGAGESL